jgi:hypothetical protein
MGYATLVLCCVLVCVRLKASGELLLIYLARMPLNDSHNTSTHVPTVTETCILKGDDKMSNDDHQRFVVQELKSAQRVEIRNLIKAHSHFLYDPTQMVVDKCSSWYGSYTPKTSDGYLDHIPEGLAGCISLSAFLLAPATCPIGRAARLVCDPDSLRFFLKEDPLSVSYCSSATHHVRFVSELLASNVCRKDRTRARGYAKFFTVVKKVDDRGIPVLRTILDCRSANEFFRQPDPVNLASLAEILAAFANVESMRTLDLRHMFHQIRLHPHLHDYFVVAFGSLRLKWQVLPMGWTWACFIAQSISTFFVAGEMAYSWSEIPRVITLGRCQFFVVYDNIIGGGPREELDLLWKGITARIASLRAVVKEDCVARNGTSFSTLGLEWFPSPLGLQWCFLPKFLRKLELARYRLLAFVFLPARELAGVLGLIAWGRYATHGSLFDMQPVYKHLAEAVEHGWNVDASIASCRVTLSEALRKLLSVGLQRHKSFADEVLVFSDAHVSGFGFVGGHPMAKHAECWKRSYESKDMFFLESIAAKHAVTYFASAARLIHLVTDNQALMLSIRKRSTACPRTAVVLAEMFDRLAAKDCSVIPHWVSTDFNPADELSRGVPFIPEKVAPAVEHVVWTVPPDPQWGSKLGRVVGQSRLSEVGGREKPPE